MARHRQYREKIESLLRNSVSRALCDRVAAQKLSESSGVSDRLYSLVPRLCERRESVVCMDGTGVHVLDLFVTPLQQIKWK